MLAGEFVNRVIERFPTSISVNDTGRIAMALGDLIRKLKIKRLNPRKQAILNVVNGRAELPNDMDLGGSLWVAVCVCDILYTIDISDVTCPSYLKEASVCQCETPTPVQDSCGCGCSCTTCNGNIGWFWDNQFWGYTSGAGWGTMYQVPQTPIGHAMLGNPYGTVKVFGNQLIFTSDFQFDEVYIRYEQSKLAAQTPISDLYKQAGEYYVAGWVLKDTDMKLALSYDALFEKEMEEIKTMRFRNAMNQDTLLRLALANFGFNNAP